MKKYFFLILLALVACKKSNKNNPPPTPPSKPPVLISGETIIYPGTPDSLFYNYVYTYNSKNMLTNISLNGTNTPITYNAKGLLTSYGSVSPGGVLFQLQYDQNYNLINSTLNTYDQESNVATSCYYTYTIVNGLVTQIQQYSSSGGSLTQTYNLEYDSNNNLVKRTTLNSDRSVYGTNTFTFGTHYSPKYTDHLKFYSEFLDYDYFNKNEVLTETSVVNGYQTANIAFNYTYNGLYPVTLIISSDGTNNYYSYTYNNLKD